MVDSMFGAGRNCVGVPAFLSRQGLFGRPDCDPDISRKDLQAVRKLVRSLPLISGPVGAGQNRTSVVSAGA
jgi:hypothetical protein